MNGETAVQRHDSLQVPLFGKLADLAVETFRIVFDGQRYALHLNEANATKFRQLMEGFVGAAEHHGDETGWAAVITDDNAPVVPAEALVTEVDAKAVQPEPAQAPAVKPLVKRAAARKTAKPAKAATKKQAAPPTEWAAPVREVRTWLREQGFQLSANGRIKDQLLMAYNEAMQGDLRRLQELKRDPRFSKQAVDAVVQESDLDLSPEPRLRSVPPVQFTAEK